MRSPTTVSVVMGVYNNEECVSRAIESILTQTLSDFEFLIIDDGSSDGTVDILMAYARKDARVRVVRNEQNRGLGYALRQGVSGAAGELIARMDADDISLPYRLERQAEVLNRQREIDVLGSFAVDVDELGRVVRERQVPTCHERIVRLIWACPMIHPTVMFRRSRILQVGSYDADIRRRQDYELWFRCAKAGLRFANIPEPLVYYHYSGETLKRNTVRSAWDQVRMGLSGCRSVRAAPWAYVAVTLPLVEALAPSWLRLRLHTIKKNVDPRSIRS